MRTPIRCALALAVLQALNTVHAAPLTEPLATRLDRLTVVGSAERAEETAGSAHYIGSEELEKFDYRDVNRVLRQVPGVYLVEEEGYGLRPNIGIRGSGTDRNSRITVMEDGVLIAPAPYAAPAAYYFPTMARMSAVEIRKGSASVKAGPRTTGGVVNLISTPIPGEASGLVDIAYGSDNTLLSHVWAGTSGERFGGLIEAVRQDSDGFKDLDGGGDTGYSLDDVIAKLRYTSAPNAARFQSIELKLGRTTQDSDETYLGLTDADFAATPNRRYAASQLDNIRTEHEQVELRHVIELGDKADLTTVAYRTEFDRNWYKLNDVQGTSLSAILENPAAFANQVAWLTGANSPDNALRVRNNNRAYFAEGLQSVFGLDIEGDVGHAIEAGIRWHRDEESRYQDDDRFRMQNGRMVLTSDGAPGTQDNRVGEAEAWSAFIQDDIRIGRWILSPGLRYEHIELERVDFARTPLGRTQAPTAIRTATVDAWIPGFGATYLMNDALTLFASVHRGFNPPGPGSNADVEESINTEFGLRYAKDAINAELVGFWNDYDNLVGTCTASTGGNCNLGDQFDGGEARIRGIEASAGYTAEAGRFAIPMRVAYTYTDASFRNSFNSSFEEWLTVRAGDELPYLPEHVVHLGTGLVAEGWRLDLNANYLDAMRTVAGSGPVPAGRLTDSAWVFDVAATWNVAANTQLFARIENALDEEYVVSRRPAGARPGQPRTGFVGVRLKF